MTTAQVVEASVTVNNNSPIQGYVHPDDQTQPTFEMLQVSKFFLFSYFFFVFLLIISLLPRTLIVQEANEKHYFQ